MRVVVLHSVNATNSAATHRVAINFHIVNVKIYTRGCYYTAWSQLILLQHATLQPFSRCQARGYPAIHLVKKKRAGNCLFFRDVAIQVSSAQTSLTSVFGMGTGGSSSLSAPAVLWGSLPHDHAVANAACALVSPFALFFCEGTLPL